MAAGGLRRAVTPAALRAVLAGDPGLHARLTYLTAFRLLIVTVLLGATSWLSLRPGEEFPAPVSALLFVLVGFVYASSLGYLWLLRLRRRLRPLAWAQIFGDLLVATFLVYLTGGVDSLFVLMYPLAIVNASILLGRSGASVATAGAALLFSALVLALDAGLAPPPASYLAQRRYSAPRLAFSLAANAVAFVLIAALASYLTDQLRRTGERLTESEDDYARLADLHRSIVRSMSAGILTADADGRVTFMNAAAEAITGLSFAHLVGEPLRLWFPSLASGVDEALARGISRGEVEEQDVHGMPRLLGFVVNRLSPGEGRNVAGFSVLLEDQSELRDMQDAMRRADRLAAVGQLAAGLAHELRNPLASMSGAIELLGRGASLSDGERRLMEIVLREAGRLNALVTDFLEFARPAPVSLQPIDVAALADEMLGVFRLDPAAQPIAMERLGPPSLRARADPARLRQVLWNLLRNAAEACAGEGRVVVEVAQTKDGRCRLAVTDTGRGIDPAAMGQLFEPFFTTKAQGTGLGLAFVHRIVEAHGGRLEVTSPPGQGATFSVFLPAGEGFAPVAPPRA